MPGSGLSLIVRRPWSCLHLDCGGLIDAAGVQPNPALAFVGEHKVMRHEEQGGADVPPLPD